MTDWEAYGQSDNILELRVPGGLHSFLHPFIIMIIQKIFWPDKLMFAITEYVW